jgi:hypothetical protein
MISSSEMNDMRFLIKNESFLQRYHSFPCKVDESANASTLFEVDLTGVNQADFFTKNKIQLALSLFELSRF